MNQFSKRQLLNFSALVTYFRYLGITKSETLSSEFMFVLLKVLQQTTSKFYGSNRFLDAATVYLLFYFNFELGGENISYHNDSLM